MNFENINLELLECIQSTRTLIYRRDVYLMDTDYVIVVFTSDKNSIRCLFDLSTFVKFDINKIYPEYKKSSRVWRIVYHDNGSKIQFPRMITNCNGNSVVDHINRNTLDNRLINLRNVSKSLNGRNCVKPKSDSTLPTGVNFDYRKDKDGNRYIRGVSAYMRIGNTSKSKFFSLKKYTLVDAIRHASSIRDIWIKEIESSDEGSETIES